MKKMATPNFDHIHPKIIEITFSFPEFAPARKKLVHSINSFMRYTVSFRVMWPSWPHPSLTMHNPQFFDQLLIYVNLYQHVKNQAISLICSGDKVDKKILQSDWLRAFWPISQEQTFSQIWDMCRNTANNVNFHHRSNSVKCNDHIFQ